MNDEYTITQEEGAVILRSKEIDLKLTGRDLWSRVPSIKERVTFASTGLKVPEGMSRDEKAVWLIELRKKALPNILGAEHNHDPVDNDDCDDEVTIEIPGGRDNEEYY